MPSGQEPLLRAKSSVVEPQLCRATNERARLERLRQYFDHKIRFKITLQYIKTTSALRVLVFVTLSANFPPPENSPADFGGPQSAT